MRSLLKTMLTALTAAAFVHMLTGWSPALVIVPVYAFIGWAVAHTWGDGPRAIRLCAEETDDD